jgi:NAD(P)-dependent dehydrogenase (short-subunit alcohol dehydrogenase family)
MGGTVVITGASGGIGRATAERFVQGGYTVYGLCRRAGEMLGVRYIATDVTDEASVRSAFELISSEAGRIDLLINNAGFGISGATEFTSLEDAKRLFDVNFFGCFLCSKYAIPLMREQGGRIVNISSAAAIFSIPFQSFYSASKSAVNSLSMALGNELKHFGISVTALMPGDVKTGFTAAREKSQEGSEVYRGVIEKSVATMEKDEINGMMPEYIAGQIYKIATKPRVRPLYAVGTQYKLFAFLSKLLPSWFINAVVGKMYVKH